MPASKATTGYRSTFSIGSGSPITFMRVAEVKTIKPPDLTAGTVEVTHLLSPNEYKEWKRTMKDHSELEITGNFIGDDSQQQLQALADLPSEEATFMFQITAPLQGGVMIQLATGYGMITKLGVTSLETEKPIEFSMMMKVTGPVSISYQVADTYGAESLASRAGLGLCHNIASGSAPSGWTDVEFDDSAWTPPVANLTIGNQGIYAMNYNIPALPANAAFVADTTALHALADVILFRIPFTLSQAVELALQISAVFNLYEVWVNGTQIYDSPVPCIAGATVSEEPISVPASLLQVGSNVLCIKAGTTTAIGTHGPFALAFATA